MCYKSGKTISEDPPDPNEELEMWNLVKAYKIHKHAKKCRNCRNKKFVLHFGKCFTSNTSTN